MWPFKKKSEPVKDGTLTSTATGTYGPVVIPPGMKKVYVPTLKITLKPSKRSAAPEALTSLTVTDRYSDQYVRFPAGFTDFIQWYFGRRDSHEYMYHAANGSWLIKKNQIIGLDYTCPEKEIPE